MTRLFLTLDRLLRGEITHPARLSGGRIDISVRVLFEVSLVLGLVYGLFMGTYGAFRPSNATALQVVATAVKVPALFVLTLVVTFPALYVFSALAGARLPAGSVLRLILAGIAVNLAVLASLGPITGFFTLSTESYAFMLVLNVVFFGISGLIGLGFIYRTLSELLATRSPLVPAPKASDAGGGMVSGERSPGVDPDQVPSRPAGELDGGDTAGRRVFIAWMVIYGMVGAQMGWVLRPFIGSPSLEFSMFRTREGNFLEGLFRALRELFS